MPTLPTPPPDPIARQGTGNPTPVAPHLRFPLRVSGGTFETVEQDSIDDIAQCAEIVMKYRVGYRTSIPEFGMPDQAFRQGGANVQEIAAALGRWEPRARALIEADPSLLDELTSRVKVKVATRGG